MFHIYDKMIHIRSIIIYIITMYELNILEHDHHVCMNSINWEEDTLFVFISN